MRTTCRSRAPRHNRRGAIIVMVALLLPAFLLIVGFSIDLAHIQLSRTEMRLAVDAAARAAAEELARTESTVLARERAKAVAAMNPVANNTLSISDSDVTFGRSTQKGNGDWQFKANATPVNSVQIVGLRTKGAIDGQVNFLMGWYSDRSGVNLTIPAVAAFRSTDISLVLDRSTSMKQSITGNSSPSYDARFCKAPRSDSGWAALDDAVAVFLSEVDATTADEQVSVVTFASALNPLIYCGALPAATLDCALTDNISKVEKSMEKLATSVWNGNTNIAAGIDLSKKELLTGPNARTLSEKFMLVMTDGNANEGNAIASATSAAAAGIKISTVTFGDEANQTAMIQVAKIGGGVHYHASTPADLVEVFRKFAAQSALMVQ
ncbi:MAG: vWA domain-containing protein [Planctomycetaceae bacterium]